MRRKWHQPVTTPAKRDAAGRPYLTVEVLNTGERIELEPQNDRGHFSAHDLDRLAHALRDQRRDNEHPFEPTLIDLLYVVQLQFKSEAVRIISAYRTPRRASRSNHGRGRALDIVIPGAKDSDVAKFVRALGFVGVGLYPTSGFVHIDVRPSSYSWIDRSGPGQRSRTRTTKRKAVRSYDKKARAAGRRPVPSWRDPAENVDRVFRGENQVQAPGRNPGQELGGAEAEAEEDLERAP